MPPAEHLPADPDTPEIPDLLTAAEVAALLRIGERALRDWDGRGWLTPIRVGKRKLYSASDLQRILRNGTPKIPKKYK